MNEIIETYKDSPISVIRAHLTIAGYSGKEVTEALKEAGVSSAKLGFASDYYDFLGSELRTREEAIAFIKEGNAKVESNNILKHSSHYLNIFDLSVTIWEAKEEV